MMPEDIPEIGQVQEKPADKNTMIDSLGGQLRALFVDWESARREKEDEWLDSLRAFNGQYTAKEDAAMAQNEHKSKVFVNLTRMKCVAAYSRVLDLLFQPGQRIGEVEPTPIPDTEKMQDARVSAMREIKELINAGAIDPSMDLDAIVDERVKELRDEAVNDAAKRAQGMNKVIDDQLAECGAETKLKLALKEMVILGDGCIKGATINIRGERKWQRGERGWSLGFEEKVYPDIQYRSIFNIYPDPYATGTDDMTGLFDRHIMTRTDFKKLGQLKGFDADKIDNYLLNTPNGNHVEANHELQRRQISGMQNASSTSGRYEVLEYWGMVSGADLIQVGVDVEDETVDYQANVWIIDSLVIKAMLNPLEPTRIPYQIFPYEFNVHSFWGIGIPAMMRDSQQIINASARIILDNAAMSSGPITEINTDLLPPGKKISDIKPWSVFARSGGDPSHPMMRFYQHPNLSGPVAGLIEMFRKFADEETSMPSYSHGQHQAGLTKTASGMSMLMGAANVSLKGVIKNIDDYLIEPLLTSFYDWNMQWNDNEDIKGDAIAVARGSSALMMREIRSERLMQFLQIVTNEVDAQFVDRRQLLEEVAASLDLNPDDFLLSEDELEARQHAMQAAMEANQSAGMGAGGAVAPGQQDPMLQQIG
jgi:hypothetical protein